MQHLVGDGVELQVLHDAHHLVAALYRELDRVHVGGVDQVAHLLLGHEEALILLTTIDLYGDQTLATLIAGRLLAHLLADGGTETVRLHTCLLVVLLKISSS